MIVVPSMRRAVPLVLCLAALAGCGGSKQAATSSTAAALADPAATLRALVRGAARPLTLLTPASRSRVTVAQLRAGVEAFADGASVSARHAGGEWAVAWVGGKRVAGGKAAFAVYAVAERLRGGRWLAEVAGPVTMTPLGPQPEGTAAPVPQVAAEIKAPRPIVDTALWVDGTPLEIKGGGPSSRYISIYGAPAAPLAKGRHVAVAFARAGADATATAWWFTVR